MTSVEKLLEDLPKNADNTLRHVQEWVNLPVTDDTDGTESEDNETTTEIGTGDHHCCHRQNQSPLYALAQFCGVGVSSLFLWFPSSSTYALDMWRGLGWDLATFWWEMSTLFQAHLSCLSAVRGMGLPSSSAAPFGPASVVQSSDGRFTDYEVLRKALQATPVKAGTGSHVQGTWLDTAVCVVPRVDKYITDFLGKRMPKDQLWRGEKPQQKRC